jgi:mono/diheme cytochrome c family protein
MKAQIMFMAVGLALTTAAAAAAQDAATIAKGQKVYAANKCTTCHSIDGKGNKKGPLDEVGSKLTADEIRAWLLHPDDMAAKSKSTRKPVMKAYDKLPKDDIEALVTYLQSLKKQ